MCVWMQLVVAVEALEEHEIVCVLEGQDRVYLEFRYNRPSSSIDHVTMTLKFIVLLF